MEMHPAVTATERAVLSGLTSKSARQVVRVCAAQISDTVYPMYKAYIEPDLKTAHLRIYNTFNPFSGFMAPTYILKSAKPVALEAIPAVLKVRARARLPAQERSLLAMQAASASCPEGRLQAACLVPWSSCHLLSTHSNGVNMRAPESLSIQCGQPDVVAGAGTWHCGVC